MNGASWLTNLDSLIFGRFHVEVSSSLSAQEALARLQSCVKPYRWPMLFAHEGLYGTVDARGISVSRYGGGNRAGTQFEFVGTLVPTNQGTALVGDVGTKRSYRVLLFLPFTLILIGIVIALTSSGNSASPPAWLLALSPVLFVLIFFLVCFAMRRGAEGFANYVGLVVGNAFSSSK